MDEKETKPVINFRHYKDNNGECPFCGNDHSWEVQKTTHEDELIIQYVKCGYYACEASINEIWRLSSVEVNEPPKEPEDELKPCPFCGGKAELFQRELFGSDHDGSKDNDNWDVRCSSDNCYLADGADWWLVKEQAILVWNTRTANTEPEDEKCIKCFPPFYDCGEHAHTEPEDNRLKPSPEYTEYINRNTAEDESVISIAQKLSAMTAHRNALKEENAGLIEYIKQHTKPEDKQAPTDSGIPELDYLCELYNKGEISLTALVCRVWNKSRVIPHIEIKEPILCGHCGGDLGGIMVGDESYDKCFDCGWTGIADP